MVLAFEVVVREYRFPVCGKFADPSSRMWVHISRKGYLVYFLVHVNSMCESMLLTVFSERFHVLLYCSSTVNVSSTWRCGESLMCDPCIII